MVMWKRNRKNWKRTKFSRSFSFLLCFDINFLLTFIRFFIFCISILILSFKRSAAECIHLDPWVPSCTISHRILDRCAYLLGIVVFRCNRVIKVVSRSIQHCYLLDNDVFYLVQPPTFHIMHASCLLW